MADSLKISILMEDQARMGFRDKVFIGQHGLSLYIEAGKRILFDTGPSDAFLENARLLGVRPEEADFIVLSHGHWDHTDGLMSLPSPAGKPSLVAHPGIFVDRRRPMGEYNGPGFDQEQLETRFNLLLSKEPVALGDRVMFLGEIPRNNDFESQYTRFFHVEDGERKPDFLPDDTALAIKTDHGLAIVTGCSHAGICNIVEYAKEVCGEQKVHAVLGGFHLLGDVNVLDDTIEYFRFNRADRLYPMHCTDLMALSRFHGVFGAEKLCAGDVVEIG